MEPSLDALQSWARMVTRMGWGSIVQCILTLRGGEGKVSARTRVCTCVNVCAIVHACMYVFVFVCVCVCTCVRVCARLCMHTCLSVLM